MSRTPARVSQDIIANLRTTLPGLSLELGTPERKIIDAVGEAISEGYLDQYVTGTTLDIDTKGGLELEQFVGIFGFGRLQGRKATGMVHVEMSVPAAQDIQFQLSSQFFFRGTGSAYGAPLFYYSTQPAILVAGASSVDIPVECTVAGTVGNVPPGTISSTSASIGSTSVTNLSPMTGGIDIESDDDLRQRFKNTFLRNIAGTEDYYRALCIGNFRVAKVAVYGPTTVYRTQVAVPSGTVALPVHQDVKYVWPEGQSVFKNLAQPGETFYTPGVDYTWSSGASASLTRVAAGQLVAGEIVDVEFEYTTRSSRNVPTTGVLNKVDIFVDGNDPYNVSEKSVVSNTLFSSTTTDPLYTGNFVRVGLGTAPTTSNRFMRLGSVPIVAFPDTLVIKDPGNSVTTTYTRGTHYHLLQGTTLLAGSEREIAGIEWLPAGPANNIPVTLTYSYNRLPQMLNAMAKASKQITTDVLIHQAEWRYLRVYLDVEYDRGISTEQANANIQVALRGFFGRMQFGEWVEMSDILMVAHQVIGVDNVVMTTSASSATNYGVKVYNAPDAANPLSTNAVDFKLSDSQLPSFLDAVITRKANR